jgi:hypothetical protein
MDINAEINGEINGNQWTSMDINGYPTEIQ